MKLLRSLFVAALVLCAPTPDQHADQHAGLTLTVQSAQAGVLQFGSSPKHSSELTVAQDLANRTGGPDVVWFHSFDSVAEVDQFRWNGGSGCHNDPFDNGDAPNTVRWVSDDGPSSLGALEIWRAPGGDDPSVWWRMFSPLTGASNGRGVDDPGASGDIARKVFTPTDCGDETDDWEGGYWANAVYHDDFPGEVDGEDYYLQMRVKIDPNRIEGTNDNGGKLLYLTRTDGTLTSQELVVVANQQAGTPEQTYYRMYRSGTGNTLVTDPPGVDVQGHQPGSDFTAGVGDGLCRTDNNGGRLANCWYWPLGEWVTVLFHITLGTADVVGPSSEGNNDTHIEVSVCEYGETAYTKIWDQPNADLPFDVGPGHNAAVLSAYMNGSATNINTGFYHRYDDLIFSRATVACPQAYE